MTDAAYPHPAEVAALLGCTYDRAAIRRRRAQRREEYAAAQAVLDELREHRERMATALDQWWLDDVLAAASSVASTAEGAS